VEPFELVAVAAGCSCGEFGVESEGERNDRRSGTRRSERVRRGRKLCDVEAMAPGVQICGLK
jgi:hypothetical protein